MTDQVQQPIQVSNQDTPAQPSASPSFAVPQEYQSAGWTEKVKSVDDLWKLTANSQSLLGKRPAGIPTSDAPPEEWDKFNAALGVPDAADKYELSGSDKLPPEMDLTPYIAEAQGLFHKAKLTPSQAKMVWDGYLEMQVNNVDGVKAQSAEREAELDKQFNDMSAKLFGDKYGEVSTKAQEFITQALPEELRPSLQNLSDNPQALLAVIKMADYARNEIATIKAKYGQEDRLSSGGGAAPADLDSVKKSLLDARTKAQKAAPFSIERKQTEADMDKLRQQLAKMVNV